MTPYYQQALRVYATAFIAGVGASAIAIVGTATQMPIDGHLTELQWILGVSQGLITFATAVKTGFDKAPEREKKETPRRKRRRAKTPDASSPLP